MSAGAILDLAGGGSLPMQYVGSYTGSGAGTVRVDTGMLKAGAAGATFNFPGTLFQWTSGTIDGGATGLTNTGVMTLSGAGTKTLNGVLHNAGTIIHAGTASLIRPAERSPDAGSIICQAEFTTSRPTSSIASNTVGDTAFHNAGILRKSGGTGTSSIIIGFTNTGRNDRRPHRHLATAHKCLSSEQLRRFAGGTFQAAAGAVLDLTGTNASISGNFTGSGQGTVRLSTGSLIVGSGRRHLQLSRTVCFSGPAASSTAQRRR